VRLVCATFAASIVFTAQAQPLPELAMGARLYTEACASCHGTESEGQPDWTRPLPTGRMPAPPHDASGHTWHHRDDVLFRLVKEGVTTVVGITPLRPIQLDAKFETIVIARYKRARNMPSSA
jgi:hypothetical protein